MYTFAYVWYCSTNNDEGQTMYTTMIYCSNCGDETEHDSPNSITCANRTYHCVVCGEPNELTD